MIKNLKDLSNQISEMVKTCDETKSTIEEFKKYLPNALEGLEDKMIGDEYKNDLTKRIIGDIKELDENSKITKSIIN